MTHSGIYRWNMPHRTKLDYFSMKLRSHGLQWHDESRNRVCSSMQMVAKQSPLPMVISLHAWEIKILMTQDV